MTPDAAFEGGVFKPARRPDLSDGEYVRITVETIQKPLPEDILKVAARVYEDLSPSDVDEVEEMARRRAFIGQRSSLMVESRSLLETDVRRGVDAETLRPTRAERSKAVPVAGSN